VHDRVYAHKHMPSGRGNIVTSSSAAKLIILAADPCVRQRVAANFLQQQSVFLDSADWQWRFCCCLGLAAQITHRCTTSLQYEYKLVATSTTSAGRAIVRIDSSTVCDGTMRNIVIEMTLYVCSSIRTSHSQTTDGYPPCTTLCRYNTML